MPRDTAVDDYHAYFRMLLNHGMHDGERILSRPVVELMTSNRLTPEQNAARTAMARDNVHISFGQGQHGGWGFGMAVRTHRPGRRRCGRPDPGERAQPHLGGDDPQDHSGARRRVTR
ncbi:hypothetical protein GCM10022225_42330 [Plantactinospora mayteni]|uniref:Uncharacterized protein n=1 Tax=Plantactinospora mayteni TaxID=566021 RepID=A0ABQ4EUB8_9ACTN|nr:hypothetical protein [Plantactinospora mayteni]GIG98257.1 hypothetical protein Pma05_48300 [Plantactinospora mayteni]